MTVSSSSVSAGEASSRTVRRRVHQVHSLRDVLGVQLEDEVKALSRSERELLLKEVALPVTVPIEHSLAIKSSLSISWNKLRTLGR